MQHCAIGVHVRSTLGAILVKKAQTNYALSFKAYVSTYVSAQKDLAFLSHALEHHVQ